VVLSLPPNHEVHFLVVSNYQIINVANQNN